MFGVVQVDEEEDVTPRVVLDVDVLLEAVAMVLEVVAVAATDEARVAHVALRRPLLPCKQTTTTITIAATATDKARVAHVALRRPLLPCKQTTSIITIVTVAAALITSIDSLFTSTPYMTSQDSHLNIHSQLMEDS